MLKRFLTISILIILCGSFTSVFSANFTSVTNGDWSTGSTWGGSAPGTSTSENITINNSVTSSASIRIKNGGYLTIKSGATLTISNDLQFDNNSHILVEPGGTLIVTGTLTNNNNSVNVEINGNITVNGNFDNGTGGVIFGTGYIDVSGSYSGQGTTFGNQPTDNITDNTTVSGGGLPVELLYFNNSVASDHVILNWATSSETNNDFFTIERSTDGVSYEVIATISGAGNSNSILTYHFSDENPITETSYYRLKQTDFDGKFEYVSTIACEFKRGTSASFTLVNSIVTDNISINLSGATGSYSVSIFNFSGQKVFESNYSLDNFYTILSIPFNAVKGYYFLSIHASDGTSNNFKLFKE
jgi:hypothetical protein